MIKNYKLFQESLLDKMKGPSDEELLNHFKKFTDSDRIKFIIKNGLDYSLLPDNLIVNGSLDCSHNEITSLPDNLKVNGTLNCNHNQLTSLPENLTVGGDLICYHNLTKLEIPISAKIGGKIIN